MRWFIMNGRNLHFLSKCDSRLVNKQQTQFLPHWISGFRIQQWWSEVLLLTGASQNVSWTVTTKITYSFTYRRVATNLTLESMRLHKHVCSGTQLDAQHRHQARTMHQKNWSKPKQRVYKEQPTACENRTEMRPGKSVVTSRWSTFVSSKSKKRSEAYRIANF